MTLMPTDIYDLSTLGFLVIGFSYIETNNGSINYKKMSVKIP